MKELILRYKSLIQQSKNLSDSNRLGSNEAAAAASIEAAKLHSEITSFIEEKLFHYTPTENFSENRVAVGKFLAWCEASLVNASLFTITSYFDGLFCKLERSLERSEAIEFTHDGVWELVDSRSEFLNNELSVDQSSTDPKSLASDQLKKLASDSGFNIIFMEKGSFHEGWLYVGFEVV